MIGLSRKIKRIVASAIALLLVFAWLGTSSFTKADINPLYNFKGRITDSTNIPVADGVYNFSFGLFTQPTGGAAIWSETLNAANMFSATISSSVTNADNIVYTYAGAANANTLRVGQPLNSGSSTATIIDFNTGANTVTVTLTGAAWANGAAIDNRPHVDGGIADINLGAVTDPSNVNFDQPLYLEITFSGETMLPRKNIVGVPQAFNAAKVGGRSATDFGSITGTTTVSGLWDFANSLSVSTSSANSALSVNQDGSGRILELQHLGADIFNVGANGFVGIGTGTPLSMLSINGDVLMEGSNRYLNFGTASGTTGYGLRDNAGVIEFKNSGGSWSSFGSGGTINPGLAGQIGYYGANGSIISATSSLFINAGGFVGVGTTTPEERLVVDGNFKLTGDILPATANQSIGSVSGRILNGYFTNLDVLNMSIASTSISGSASNVFTINSGNVTNDAEDSSLAFHRGSAVPEALLTWNSTADRFEFNFPVYSGSNNILTLGNIGIGTTTPSVALSVGANVGQQFLVNNSGIVSDGTWQGDPIAAAYGGTGQNSSGWTGFAFVNGGVWSASSSVSASYLPANLLYQGNDITLLTNNAGFITATSADALANKTGNISMWTNNAGYITSSSAEILTNKSGQISMWTNDSGYLLPASITNFITATSSDTLTNKSGNISMWTNNVGYITSSSAETLANKTWQGNVVGLAYGGLATNTSAFDGLIKISGGNTTAITDNSANWNTAFGWGNHATYGYITSSSAETLTNKTWNGNAIGSGYGGTGQNSSGWTGYAFVTGGVWSATSSIPSGSLPANLVYQGDNISWLANNVGYITSSSAETLTNKTWQGNIIGSSYLPVAIVYQNDDITRLVNNAGYITSSSAETLTNKAGQISMWTNDAGYISSYVETDPIYSVSAAAAITAASTTNWTTAYGWGNHALAGYITDGNINWDNSYGFITASSSETLTNKTWNGNVIGIAYGGTGTSTQFAPGSIVFAGENGVYSQNNSSLYWDNVNLRLGLGTSTPAAALNVRGINTQAIFETDSLGAVEVLRLKNSNGGGNAAGIGFYVSGISQSGIFAYDAGNLLIQSNGASSNQVFRVNGVDRMRINASGNVGIGTSSPSAMFTVGATSSQQFLVNNLGVVTGGTWQGSPIGQAYGGTGTSSVGWTGYAFVTGGVWSATSSIPSGSLPANLLYQGDNISWLANNTGYITSSSAETLTNKAGLISMWTNNAGYLTSYIETDPIFGASEAGKITAASTTNWSTAYGWGNHAGAGYLTSFTETDPIYAASVAQTITIGSTTNWTTAYGWGNHATYGYITDGNTNWDNAYGFITASSTDTLTNKTWQGNIIGSAYLPVTVVYENDNITRLTNNAGYITSSSAEILTNKSGNISMWTNDSGYISSYVETDPIYSVSAAAAITSASTTNWTAAYGWGNHALAGYITDGNVGWDNSYGFITATSSDTLTNKTWQGSAIGQVYGGTGTSSAAWTGYAFVTGGTWSATSSIPSGSLPANLLYQGDNISWLANNTGYITSTSAETLINKTWQGDTIGLAYGGLATNTSAFDGLIKISGSITSYIPDTSANWNTAYGWGNHATFGYITSSSAETLTNKTWNGNIIGAAYGGIGTSSAGWTGYAFVNGGIWSATSSLPSGALPSNLMYQGDNISLLTNDAGYLLPASIANFITASSSETLTNKTWQGNVINVAYGGTGTSTQFTPGSIVFADANGVYNQNNPSLFWDNANARLGIGTSTPSSGLSVFGGASISGGVTINTISGVDLNFAGAAVAEIGTSDNSPFYIDTNNIQRIAITASGNVGIGTSSPSTMFTVGATSSQQFLVNNLGVVTGGTWQGSVIGVAYGGTGTSTAPTYGQLLMGNGAGGYNLVSTSSLGFVSGSVVSSLIGTAAQVLVSASSGAVTLSLPQDIANTSNPTFAGLSLSGLTSGSLLFAAGGGLVSQDNSNFFWDNTNKRLGIGTNLPGDTLDIFGAGKGLRLSYDGSNQVTLSSSPVGELNISSSASTTSSGVTIGNGLAKDVILVFDASTTDYHLGVDNTDGLFKIGTGSALGTNDHLTVSTSGYIGIGTATPSSMLSVGATSSQQFLVNDLGVVTGGTWQGSPIGQAYGGTGTSSAGWSGYAFVTGGAWSATSSIPSGSLPANLVYQGDDITWLVNNAGYITSSSAETLINKTWNGSIIDLAYGGLATNTSAFDGFVKISGGITTYVTDNSANWNTAYGWGNHASSSYLTSFTETDPIFVASEANNITAASTTNWNTAYGWGNHALAGYIVDGNTNWDNLYGFITATSSETLTNKTWNGNVIDVAYGGTGTSTAFTPGSIVFVGGGGAYSQDNNNFFWDSANGRLGIGTNNPQDLLDIYGAGKGLRLSYDGSNFVSLSSSPTGELTISNSASSTPTLVIGSGQNENAVLAFDASSTDYLMGLDTADGLFKIGMGNTLGSSTALVINPSGYVGIGTTSAAYALDVKGEVYASNGVRIPNGYALNLGASGVQQLYGDATGFRVMVNYNSLDAFHILNSGNVGIGTNTPSAMLTVGATSTQQFLVNNLGVVTGGTWQGNTIGVAYGGTGTSTQFTPGSIVFAGAGGVYGQDNANLFWDDANGYLGLGTSSPTAALDITSVLSESTVGSEMIINVADRDFSSDTGNWSGGSWLVSGGVATHTASTTAYVLDNTALTAAPVAEKIYQITFTANTIISGSLTVSFGGANGSAVGKATGTLTAQVQAVAASDVSALTFVPDGNWVGTIDNISVKEITLSPASQIVRNSDGSIGLEIRSGGATVNTFMGARAGRANSAGAYNVGLGDSALMFNINGSYNTAVGSGALANNTTGSFNSAFGENVLSSNTSGQENSAFGRATLANNVTGSQNSAYGRGALRYNFAGSYNTASGYYAGSNNLLGGYNTILGAQAGYGVSGQSYANNSLFGYRAGYGLSTGSNNLLMGYQAGDNLTSGSNNIIIGYDINAASSTGSNQLNIGNAIYGNLSNGYVAIGTSTASSMLTVGATSTQQFLVNNLGVVTGGTWQGGVIGIAYGGTGTSTAPTYGQLLMGNASGGYDLVSTSSLGLVSGSVVSSLTGTAAQIYVSASSGAVTLSLPQDIANTSNPTFASLSLSGLTSGSLLFAAGGGLISQDNANFFYDSANHRLGLGTINPQDSIDIFGAGKGLRLSYDGSNYVGLASNANGELMITSSATSSDSAVIIGNGLNQNVSMIFDASTTDYHMGVDVSDNIFKLGLGQNIGSSTLLAVDINGRLGIGSSSPLARLSVKGAAGTTPLLDVSSSTDASLFRVNSNGNVGIGNSSPSAKLEVVGDIVSKGTFWTAHSVPTPVSWSNITYGNGLFVAISNDDVMVSSDGVNWRMHSPAESNFWSSVTYGNGLFVAVAGSGGVNQVMTSPDGINWTARTAAADSNWYSVAYGKGLFVAVSTDGDIMSSHDGINWTARTAPEANSWNAVTYGNGLFVAVSEDGTNRVMTSPDGVTWTPHAGLAGWWDAVTYGNGLFVAVSYGSAVMTSPNGSDWTSRADNSADGWNAVTYGNGLFVAVSLNGTLITSPDGINWTPRPGAENNNWVSVTYGNGLFVAISSDGANRVMTSGKSETNLIAVNNIYQGGMNIFGNVGFGTTSPSAMLTVGATSSQQLLVNNLGVITGGTWQGGVIGVAYGGTGTSTAPTLGQLLMGNASGGYDLVGTTSLGLAATSHDHSGVYEPSFTTLGVTKGGTGTSTTFTAGSIPFIGADGTYQQDNANLHWDEANMRLGVGTSTSESNLHVAAVGALMTLESTGFGGGPQFRMIGRTSGGIEKSSIINMDANSGELALSSDVISLTAISTKLAVTSGGVGIGTSTPAALLNVYGSSEQLRLSYDNDTYSGMTIDSSGNLSVQNTGGYLKLNAAGIQNYLQIFDATGSNYIQLTHDGTNGLITTNTGNIELGSAGDLTLGNGVNIVGEGNFDIKGSASTSIITLGDTSKANDDIVAIDASNWTVATSGMINASFDGVGTKVVGGTVDDTSFTNTAFNGLTAIDSSNGRIYFRYGGAWHYVNQTGGFQIPNFETAPMAELNADALAEASSSLPFEKSNFPQYLTAKLAAGDLLIPYVDQYMSDGAVHGLYARFDDVKAMMFADAFVISHDGTVTLGSGKEEAAAATTTDAEIQVMTATTSVKTAFVVNQAGAGDVADFKAQDVSVMTITDNTEVKVVGTLDVNGRVLVCAGGICPADLRNNIDETMGDMGVEGKIIAGSFQGYCEDGFVWVPGSAKYGTMPGFCVMSDLAQKVGTSTVPAVANGELWNNISQGESQLACQSLGSSYHLLSENEWLTLAENISRTATNDTDKDAIGLQLATASTTYVLSNGNMIYNLAGTTTEWTDQTVLKAGLPAMSDGLNVNDWQEYSSVIDYKGMSIAPAYYLSSANGIGKILTSDNAENLRGFIRGYLGVYGLDVSNAPTAAKADVGFRCAK